MFSQNKFYGALLLVAALVLAVGCSTAARAASVSTAANRTITVVGVGKASGTPDVAQVTVGVETRSESVQQAADENAAKMAQLLEAIKKLGIADKDIRTSNYSVYADSQPIPGPEVKGGEGTLIYHVNNQVLVTVRDLDKLGDVLDTAVAVGANNIYGVSFSVADPSKLEAEARANAVADAKARAESLAKLAGVSVGDVLTISEVIGGPGPVFYEGIKGMGPAAAPIQPGELEVSMSVQVTYAIE